MKIPQTSLQKTKGGVHFAQAVCIFIGGCLALAVLTEDGGTGGQVGFYFALCFLTIPALIYQIMVPMWTRAWRFANVYAYAALDLLYTLLWFAAFIAVAVWQGHGKSENDKTSLDQKNSNGGSCTNFAYGSVSKCETAKASVAFGVIIWLLFIATSVISIQGVLKYRSTGVMPNGDTKTPGHTKQVREDPNKDAWSANTDELDRPSTSDQDLDPRRAYGQLSADDEENLLRRPSDDQHSMTEHGMHPGRPLSFHSATSGGGLSIVPPPSYHERPVEGEGPLSPTGYVAPSALSPSDYGHPVDGRVNFPEGNYSAGFVR